MIIINYNFVWIFLISFCNGISRELTKKEVLIYKERVVNMFNHAYENYLKYAQDFDELKPITCQGVDTWGNFSLSLIDSLDSLIFFGNYTEFIRIANYIINYIDFDQNINVSVFETNIRVVGGLLSAHLLSYKTRMSLDPGWPCSGPLLTLAETVARKLLPAFQTPTGMPYGTINLKYGVPLDETPITCTAGIGSFILEFGTLSRLTNDPIFEETALKALDTLHSTRSKLDLVGNHINVLDGKWTAIESSIGAGIDSFFEYLVKGALLFKMPKLMEYFQIYYKAINKYIKKEDWYFVVHMANGLVTMPVFQSLESFFPGLLTLIGYIDQAKKSLLNYYQVIKKYGFIPEYYDVCNSEIKRNGYPLRPEFVESLFYLYKATKDPHIRLITTSIIESIEHSSKTRCGYATIKNVDDHSIEDRMESFFLAETLKYLYLLFDDDNFVYNDGGKGTVIKHSHGTCIIDSGGYIFNTEAHPIDIALVDCCQAKFRPKKLNQFEEKIDLYSLFGRQNSIKSNSAYKMNRKNVKLEDVNENQNKKNDFHSLSMTQNVYPSTDVTVTIKEQNTSPLPLTSSHNLKEIESSIEITDILNLSLVESTLNISNFVPKAKSELSPLVSQSQLTIDARFFLPSPSPSLLNHNLISKTTLTSESIQSIAQSSIVNLKSIFFDQHKENENQNQYLAIKEFNPILINPSYSNGSLLLCKSLPFASCLAKYGQVLININN